MTADLYWFHVPNLPSDQADVPLPDDQAHHARSVLRLQSGAQVILFDGRGTWAEGTLQTQGKRDATARLTAPPHHDPEPALKLTLATAVPKGDRAEWLVEQASQLGAWSVQWLDCDRGVVKPRGGGNSSEGTGKLDKWRRLAVESAKQCARTWVLQIEPLATLETVLAAATGGTRHAKVLWLEPREGIPLPEAIRDASDLVALIGPEGGWSDREMQTLTNSAAKNAVARVKLTPTVLRIETACAAVAAVVACR